jgi:Na+-translocating ferredoxin:NAD+ oxidoreductase RnfC subunit
MHKDAELMMHYADRVVEGMQAVMRETGAQKGVIGIKAKNAGAIEALEKHAAGVGIELHILGDFYPVGDEFVLVYEVTGRLIPPGGIPPNIGAVVLNVETLYNIAEALDGSPVRQKFLTVTGAVNRPVSCAVPIGMTLGKLIELAGGSTVDDPAMMVSGTMMGQLTHDQDECVTKTTGGLIVLPGDHALINRLERPKVAQDRIGKSACDQCSYCTELCPRYMLGYAIEPHKVMRSLVFSISGSGFWSRWGMLCCECGLCTLYACPEDLYPREACQQSKQDAREKNLPWTPALATQTPGMAVEVQAHPMYESRRIPVKQLVRRLGLTAYDVPAPFIEPDVCPPRIRLGLKQHAGAPAQPTVAVGDRVTAGDCVADVTGDALGARIHTSISGTVRQVDPEIVIEAL